MEMEKTVGRDKFDYGEKDRETLSVAAVDNMNHNLLSDLYHSF
mgnify:CR=1 FL=1